MTKIPSWIADGIEYIFKESSYPVTIIDIKPLSEYFLQITLQGDFSTMKKKFIAGNVFSVRVSPNDFRHYTISHFDQKNGIGEVIFFLNKIGIGSHLKVGQMLSLMGFGGKINYDEQSDFHFIFGDETSLGLMKCMTIEAQKYGHQYFCLAELKAQHRAVATMIVPSIETCEASQSEKASFAIERIKSFLSQYQEDKNKIIFYLTGNAKSILNIQKHLLQKGIQRTQIKNEPYWVEGKKGL